jgi:transglycosylase-like protein with SLT domain
MGFTETNVSINKDNRNCSTLFKASDVKPLAKRAWSRPYGPKKAQKESYKHRRYCHADGKKKKIVRVWETTKKKLAPLREKGRLYSECSNDSVHKCIKYASKYEGGADYEWLDRIANCESEYDPHASNASGAEGLFQFLLSTWNTLPSRISSHSRSSARWASLGAAEMYRQGRQGEWSCN